MTSPAPASFARRAGGRRRLAIVAVSVGIVIAAAITAHVVTSEDGHPVGSSDARLAQVQASCRDWMGSSEHGATDDQWCTDMFTWMGDESGGSMMGSMMWQGPERMGSSCRAWTDQERPDAAGQQLCDDMVEWMTGHMPSRDGNWMMQDR